MFTAKVGGREFHFMTSPSLFSRERLDEGTRFLLETILPVRERRILDLGCGYGPLGIILAALKKDARVVLVDKDPRATRAALRNIELNGLVDRARVVLSDGCRELDRIEFDLIVSHFPLHVSSHQLTRILTEAREHTVLGGRVVGVALEAYDVRPLVSRVFGNVKTLARSTLETGDSTYRVVEATRTSEGES
jgi:16S rRNA (guanine1207-N2)-methyltransferase